MFGVHESPRNTTAVLFGWDITKTFCARNGLAMVVRSHQSKKYGLGFDLMHDEKLIRVFSARDYEGHCNDGAGCCWYDLLQMMRNKVMSVHPACLFEPKFWGLMPKP